MKKISLLLIIIATSFTSCNSYLDLVPDDITQIEDLFTTKTDALNALGKIYSYLPVPENVNVSPFLLGDEYVYDKSATNNMTDKMVAQRIMRNLQSIGDPLLGIWSGTGQGKHYYVGIRHCDLVLKHVDLVYDMSEEEKSDMKAQVEFLKAYYAFLLIQHYGPIIIPKYLETDETDPAKLFPARASIDESFDYVIDIMQRVIPKLRSKVSIADYGQVDQTVAKSILARVLVFRASPFFNGNNDLYGTFKNIDETHFFPQEYKKEKWKDALDALDDAIKTCEDNGISFYNFQSLYYKYDSAFVDADSVKAQQYYTRRFILTEPWNSELIWGHSDYFDRKGNSNDILSNACNIRLPDEPQYKGLMYAENEISLGSGQSLSASYQMLERYYSENGVPIDEDRTYPNDEKRVIVSVPQENDPEYQKKYIGLMQPGHPVVKLLLNRELRFYADLVITGGYSRSHNFRITTSMFQGTHGGRNTSRNQDDYFCTGIGIQKMVHPESASGIYFAQIRFPYPYIRLADLYLMRAEARNEYEGPGPEVWADVNKIRNRAGLKNVEDVWSNENIVMDKALNKHKNLEDMREIILRERSIEFAFEGIYYWDIVRYKKATTAFSQPIEGWNVKGETAEDFFGRLESVQLRKFPLASYLWPIPVNEMNINSNLINNPGWQ
jgi:hypothetical protein